ncbi:MULTISPECIES: SDR family NAD(P)-dependent oxidoreductase [Clostridioides]|uniref:SDR family NAD(P)-dependent oxidoreductase n=1 Tax=Clostridioides sp. ZZV14-6387 TaxID=2811497 RepID=UPI0007BB3014|nr:SDR family oxidoreductase [Clostridioides sp. ZZV14-6387]MDB3083369.1 SDR family NAD(P)-dependent oxidoreductase [Clostridioides difficile]MDI0265097.1 SDR family oxidoreductase [Clostridioides difficile]MDI7818104.1 SDR family oxidoreductase [Clostridioides difficile]CZR97813.1 Levodione reductase [Clostridioides difficile]
MSTIIKDRFKDKVMIVTGASGGIGKAIALRAAKEGAKLVLADKKEEMGKKTLMEIKEITPNVEFLILDLKTSQNCKKVIDTAINKFGRLDILINNAGITGIPAPVHEMSEEMFRHVFDCNVMSAFHCSHFSINEMIKLGNGGVVINVSSVAGLTGFPGHSAYVTSKHALNGLTKNMALDYAKNGIRVNAINPGTTDTPMYHEALEFLNNKRKETGNKNTENGIVSGKTVSPQNRVASAEEVGDVTLFLASDEASNVTGIFMPVDGGFTAF